MNGLVVIYIEPVNIRNSDPHRANSTTGQPHASAGVPSYTPATDVQPMYADAPAASAAAADTAAIQRAEKKKVKGSFAGSAWVALILGSLLLILLLVFILQNQHNTRLHFITWEAEFPVGVGMLIASIVGALIMALVGGVRIIQLRSQVKKAAKN